MYSDNTFFPSLENSTSSQKSTADRQIQDYSQFNPHKYISEYYSRIGEENRFLLEFYQGVYKNASSEASLLEFGGGPTIYQLISAGQKVKEIVFAEYLECNRKEVSRWIHAHKEAINWDQYLDYVLQLDCQIICSENRKSLENTLKHKITEIIECDAYLPDVLKGFKNKKFDFVSSGFCLECISPTEQDFTSFVEKLAELVKKEGLLVMTLLKNSEFYKINELSFPTFPIDEDFIQALLKDLGFTNINIESIAAEEDQGYEGIIALTARK